MAGAGWIGGGVVLLLIGIVIIVIGTYAVPYELPKKKADFLVIDSQSSPQFNDWAGGYDKKTEYQMVFYFYNLTNPDDVRQAAAVPNYTTLGPYVYRRYRQSTNVSFPDNGNQIQFNDFRQYQYDLNASEFRSNGDMVTNVNPVFFAALAQAGNEQSMLVAATGGLLSNFTNYFTGPFINLYTGLVLPKYFPAQMDAQIAAINKSLHDTDAARDYFISAWCNSTGNVSLGDFHGLQLSTYKGQPTNITKDSAYALLDPDMPLSLLHYDNITAWTWDRALTNESYSLILRTAFKISAAQVEAIWHWRVSSFGPLFIHPGVIEKYSLDSISDLGWVQWSQGLDILGGNASAPVSVYDAFTDQLDELGFYFIIELFANLVFPVQFNDWRATRNLFDPKTGLQNIANFQAFVLAASNSAKDYSAWGLTYQQAQQLYGYSVVIGIAQVPYTLMNYYGPSGGLMLTQSIDEWLFKCDPFLMSLLLPMPLPCAILLNNSIYVSATIASGKNNMSAINQYLEFNGSPKLRGVWNKDIDVVGCTELGQFSPDDQGAAFVQTFNVEFARTMTLNKYQQTRVQGMNTNQFVLDPDTFSPDDTFYQSIPGFTNMTTVKHAPIFYSMWDMHNVSKYYQTRYIGANSTSTLLDDNTVIDVEPITGNTLRSRKRLQANIFAPPNCTWCVSGLSPFNNLQFQEDTFYPFVKAGEYVEISDQLAFTTRLQIAALKYGPRLGLIIGLALGLLMVVMGVAMMIYGRRKRRDYLSLNDRFSP